MGTPDSSPAPTPYLRLLSWNMGCGGPGPRANWQNVRDEAGVDIALLQEAPEPFGHDDLDVVPRLGSFWMLGGRSRARTCIARLSDRVRVEEIPARPLGSAGTNELAVSYPGSLTAAVVTVLESDEQFVVVSAYAPWESPLGWTHPIYSDASMHRLLSDLSPLLCTPRKPVILAGDFNSVLDSRDDSAGADWTGRNASVFRRLGELGLSLAGPQAPLGRQATPRPPDLPEGTKNVPTFRTTAGNVVNQLDYAYVTRELHGRVEVAARNEEHDWGPSDHCRLTLEVTAPKEKIWTEATFAKEMGARRGPRGAEIVERMLQWAREHKLRTAFADGDDGQMWLQLDGGPADRQFTFSVRTKGDVVIQFQWMTAPFHTPEARERLRTRLNGIAGISIETDRLGGRPSVPLDALADPPALEAFLDAFGDLVTRTREAARE